MEFRPYVELVAALRQAQKSYFTTRDTEDLRRARSLEHRIDIETAKLLEPQRELDFGGDS
jgi:hypothetical protein